MIDFGSNTGLVYDVFNRQFQYARYLEDDLIQEGMLALYKACEDFKPDRGIEFSTYACKCIEHAMGMFMRKENKINERCVSINDKVKPDSEVIYEDTLESEDYNRSQVEYQLEQVMEIIKDEPQYMMVKMKLEGKTQAEIAKKLGITQCSVSEQLRGLYARVRNKLGIQQPVKKTNKKK